MMTADTTIKDRHEHAKLTLHFLDHEDRQVIFLLLLADGGQVLPAIDLLCDSGFIDAWIKADQHRIDVGGDERAAARCRLAALQRWRDGKLDRLGVEQREPCDGIARGGDHSLCQPDDRIGVAVRSERHFDRRAAARTKCRRRSGNGSA